jgi:multidrug efflux system outer membrane protein
MIKLLTESRDLMQARYKNGAVSEMDVSRSQTELSTAQTSLLSIVRQRANAEHALAVLLGKTPAEFNLAKQTLPENTLQVPAGLPSSLLERRPDIAAAERAMAADNSRIGIARAAFFPRLSLTGALGYESSTLGDLAQWSNRTFLLGPVAGTILSLPLFDGGQRKAGVAQARAAYEASVANYRQTVLNAFREVENGLSDQRILDQQISAQAQALIASRHANKLSHLRYREGVISYLDVIDSDRTTLQQEQLAAQLHGSRMIANVDLIRALGGGWNFDLTQKDS